MSDRLTIEQGACVHHDGRPATIIRLVLGPDGGLWVVYVSVPTRAVLALPRTAPADGVEVVAKEATMSTIISDRDVTFTAPRPAAPAGCRWGLVAPSGSWTPTVRAVHRAQVLEALEHPEWGHEWCGPGQAPGLPCALLSADDDTTVAPLTGPARTYRGRALYILADGSVWAHCLDGQLSGIEYGVCWASADIPDLPGVPDRDSVDSLRAVRIAGAIWLYTWTFGSEMYHYLPDGTVVEPAEGQWDDLLDRGMVAGLRPEGRGALLTSPSGPVSAARAAMPDVVDGLAQFGLAPHQCQ